MVMGRGDAAGAERRRESRLACPACGSRGGGQTLVGRRPAALAVERDLVGSCRARARARRRTRARSGGCRPGTCARAVAEHLDLAGRVGLHPHGGLVLADVAQEGTQERLGHRGSLTGRRRLYTRTECSDRTTESFRAAVPASAPSPSPRSPRATTSPSFASCCSPRAWRRWGSSSSTATAPHPNTYLGPGKLDELKAAAQGGGRQPRRLRRRALAAPGAKPRGRARGCP